MIFFPTKELFEIESLKDKSFFNHIGEYVLKSQNDNGTIPSNADGSFDPWDFIESITAINFIGDMEKSEKAFLWLKSNQNKDGSWYAKYSNDGSVLEKNKPTHFSPYISIGLLHYYKIFSNKEFLKILWPTLEKAINFSLSFQIKNGTIPWSIDHSGNIERDYLLTGSSSILKGIDCAIAIGKILGYKNQDKWINSYKLLSKAIRKPFGLFDLQKDRSNFSMDSYYPVLSGCLSSNEIEKHIKNTLDNFYDEGLGIRCVQEEPWITVAETNEFIIALVMAKNKKLAKKIFTESLRISDEKNIPYMGWQHSENIFWPDERPTWTSAAVLLAADTIFEFTKGFNLFLENQSDLY